MNNLTGLNSLIWNIGGQQKMDINFMKRSFYFIQDSVTGQFYDGQSVDGFVDFTTAAVYFRLKNIENKIKENTSLKHTGSWTWYEKYWVNEIEFDNESQMDFHNKIKKLVTERKYLPNWGMKIVEVEVSI